MTPHHVLEVHTELENWRTSRYEFPAEASAASQLRFLLRYAVLAPSILNSQPWLFRISGDTVTLYADFSRGRPLADPLGREVVISCGAALLNLRLAIRNFGYQYVLDLLPDASQPDLLARVRLAGRAPADAGEKALFSQIESRHTDRLLLAATPGFVVPTRQLQEAAAEEMARLALAPCSARESIADLVAEADRVQMRDAGIRREWSGWLRKAATPTVDGIRVPALGWGNLWLSWLTFLLRFSPGRNWFARKHRAEAMACPALAVLGAGGDERRDWLNAGQALGRVLLTARVHGLSASFFSQPVQVPECREKLRTLLLEKLSPQLVMRLGVGSHGKPTPRRDVDEVLVSWEA